MGMDFQPANPDEIKFTLTITMTLADWKKLASQIDHKQSWPGWNLESQIRDMVSQAGRQFYPRAED